MPNKTLLPPPYLTLEDINGATITGGTVTFLETGTSVLAVVYADADGLVISANPLTVDGAGRYTVYLTPGQVVDVEYRDGNGTLIKTVDEVTAIPSASGNVDTTGVFGETVTTGQLVYLSDGTGGKTAGRWWLANQQQNQGLHSTVGLALSGGAAGAGGTVRTEGRMDGLSGLVVGARYFASVTPGALALTFATGYRLVGQADSTTSLVLTPNPLNWQSYVDFLAPITPQPQLTFVGPAQTVLLNPGANLVIQGIKAGYHGQRVRLVNRSAGMQIDFAHQSVAAAATDRLMNWVTSAPTSIVPGGVVDYEYDVFVGTWRLVAHEQGGYIMPAFVASDYSASGGMTWVPTAGQVARCAYYVKGRQLHFLLILNGSDTGGVTNTQLVRKLPGGLIAQGSATGTISSNPANAGDQYFVATGTVSFYKDFFATTNWPVGAGAVFIRANITCELQ